MREHTSSGVDTPDTQSKPRLWAFTMDGYLPPADTASPGLPPTAADLAFDRMFARLDVLRQRLAARLPFAPHRTCRDTDTHERTA